MTKSKAHAKESQTYQSMLAELDTIVRSVGQGQLDLDDIVEKIEQGYKLIGTMRERLDSTKAKVEAMRVDFEQTEKHTEKRPAKQADDGDSDRDDDPPF